MSVQKLYEKSAMAKWSNKNLKFIKELLQIFKNNQNQKVVRN